MSAASAGGRIRARTVGAALLREWPLPRPVEGGGKEARGRVLVVGGERELVGAVRLSGEAALRAGAGKLQLAVAASGAPALGVAVPEARVLGLPESASGRLRGVGAALRAAARRSDALVLGPGLASAASARVLAAGLLPQAAAPVVLDAGLRLAARRVRGVLAEWFVADTRQQLGGLSLALGVVAPLRRELERKRARDDAPRPSNDTGV